MTEHQTITRDIADIRARMLAASDSAFAAFDNVAQREVMREQLERLKTRLVELKRARGEA